MRVKRRLRGSKEELRKHHLDQPPEGTKEELEDALGKALTYQLSIIDYSDKKEFPEELVKERKRLDFYGVRGPRRGFSIGDDKSKLWQADVLYILSCTVPSSILARKYNVNRKLIERIRSGEESSWQYEWRLIRRIRTALKNIIEQKNIKQKVYVLKNKEGEILNVITSLRKAREYRNILYPTQVDIKIEKIEVLS